MCVRLPVRLHRGVQCLVRLAVLDAVPVEVMDTVPLAVGVGVDDAVRVCVPDAAFYTIAYGIAEGIGEG